MRSGRVYRAVGPSAVVSGTAVGRGGRSLVANEPKGAGGEAGDAFVPVAGVVCYATSSLGTPVWRLLKAPEPSVDTKPA